MEKPCIGIIGEFQSGKSTLVNCLLGVCVAQTGGSGLSETHTTNTYKYGRKNRIYEVDGIGYNILLDDLNGKINSRKLRQTQKVVIETAKYIKIELNSRLLRDFSLIDTPGFNANEKDSLNACEALNAIDIAIVVVNNKGLSDNNVRLMQELTKRNMPFFCIMNCLMQQGQATWNPVSNFNLKIIDEAVARLKNENVAPPLEILPSSFIWYWYASGLYKADPDDKRNIVEEDINLYIQRRGSVDFVLHSNIPTFLGILKDMKPLFEYHLRRKNISETFCLEVCRELDDSESRLTGMIGALFNEAVTICDGADSQMRKYEEEKSEIFNEKLFGLRDGFWEMFKGITINMRLKALENKIRLSMFIKQIYAEQFSYYSELIDEDYVRKS